MADPIRKQSSEKFPIGASIYQVQEQGETITLGSSTVTAVDSDGTDVSSTFLDAATKSLNDDARGGTDNVLQIKVQDGSEAGSEYKVTFLMVTSLGNTYEVDRTVIVEEI